MKMNVIYVKQGKYLMNTLLKLIKIKKMKKKKMIIIIKRNNKQKF